MRKETKIAAIAFTDPTYEVANSLLAETDKTETNLFINRWQKV